MHNTYPASVSFFFLFILVAMAGCKKCADYSDFGNPPHRLQLKSQLNQDLWFGAAAIFNPDSARFIHQTKGVLDFTVNPGERVIELQFPPTNEENREITLILTSTDSDRIVYHTQYDRQECQEGEVLRFLDYEGIRACTNCGDGRFNTNINIVLRKNL